MSLLKEAADPDSEANFDFYKALFGDEKAEETSEAPSKTDLEIKEDVKQSSLLARSRSLRESSLDSHLYRRRRTSSFQRELMIVQSIRKLSSIKTELDAEFAVHEQSKKPVPPEILHHVEAQHKAMVESLSKTLDQTREKLLKIGSTVVNKSARTKSSAPMESLLAKMDLVRENLSKKRRKLIASFCVLDQLNKHNTELDQRIQNIRLEDLHDLQVEVNRTGEKIDETRKQMAKARSRYESDLCMASHIREKWYVFQNKILGQLEDKYEMDRDIRENRVYMCGLLKRKQQLRKERLQLKKQCRLIDNEALLRKYDDAVEGIAAIRAYTKKFNEL
ncbi:hypothetical protein pipiens_001153 [Culex pipiens pipiens]|uniref:CCDC113/CCDC96 coiled-coil domain-containing protein n=1 Tax=Culex pipiens pipiens TaxID=38569 RepID=A0ABD1DK81_CULPP